MCVCVSEVPSACTTTMDGCTQRSAQPRRIVALFFLPGRSTHSSFFFSTERSLAAALVQASPPPKKAFASRVYGEKDSLLSRTACLARVYVIESGAHTITKRRFKTLSLSSSFPSLLVRERVQLAHVKRSLAIDRGQKSTAPAKIANYSASLMHTRRTCSFAIKQQCIFRGVKR